MVIILQILNEYTLADDSERAKDSQIQSSDLAGENPADKIKNEIRTTETEKDKFFAGKILPG